MEVRDGVATMEGMQLAIDGKFAPMLVPWTVLAPAVDRVNPDTGNVETLIPSGSGADLTLWRLRRKILRIPTITRSCGLKNWMPKQGTISSMMRIVQDICGQT